MIFLVCVLAAVAQQAPARDQRPHPAPAASAISGRVLSDTGAPIRKARVTIAEEGKPAEREPVFTDEQGRFEFAEVSPGRYTLTASKAGYVTTRAGARQSLEPAAPISVEEKSTPLPIDLRLPRAAAINGRVVDESGEPIVEAPVTASRMTRTTIGTRLVTAATTTTDDLGEYRLSGLAGGLYVVSTEPASSVFESTAIFSVNTAGDAVLGSAAPRWTRVYYPSATSLAQAQPVSLRAAQEVASVELTVRPRTIGRVSITVTDASGAPASGVAILESTSGLQPMRQQQTFVQGRLPIAVDPGEWDVVLDGRRAGSAMTHITVGESDLVGAVTLGKAPRVSGRVLVDGGSPPSAAGLEAFVPDVLAGGRAAAVVNRDGSFTFSGLFGTFELRLVDAPRGWFIQSVSVGGRRLPDTSVKVAGPSDLTDVIVEVSSRPSVIGGTVTLANGAPAPGMSVLVFPKNSVLLANATRWARWLKTDQKGRFTTGELPAGDFYAIAVADVDDSQWSSPEYLEPLRGRAVSVPLGPGERKAVTLTAESVQ